MLSIVDTSVWIDFFRGKATEKSKILCRLISRDLSYNVDLACTGVILTEVLLGFKNESQLMKARNLFEKLIYLETDKSTYVLASEIYRNARKRGITIRSSIDCIISASALQHGAYLLENDRDFSNIAKFCNLKLIRNNVG